MLTNLLYFAGLPGPTMLRLFPPPTYVMPDDFLFEASGVLQVLTAAVTAWNLYRLARAGDLIEASGAGEYAGLRPLPGEPPGG